MTRNLILVSLLALAVPAVGCAASVQATAPPPPRLEAEVVVESPPPPPPAHSQ